MYASTHLARGRLDIAMVRSAFVAILFALAAWTPPSFAKDAKRHIFTVEDEIGLADFGDISYSGKVDAITWSPDRKFVAVVCSKGALASDLVESEIRIYGADQLRDHVRYASGSAAPTAIWTIKQSSPIGPTFRAIRWAAKSDGIAFLQTTADESLALVYADLRDRTLSRLSRPGQDVTAFDVSDKQHYVFAVRSPVATAADGASLIPASGRTLGALILPAENASLMERSILWRAASGRRSVVRDASSGEPIVLFDEGLRSLRISPNGQWILTVLPPAQVPNTWAKLFPAAYSNSPFRVTPGPQELDVGSGVKLVGQYVLIDARRGAARALSDAPTGRSAGWFPLARPVWSADSEELVVPSAFLQPSGSADETQTPCVARYQLRSSTLSCVTRLPKPGARSLKSDRGPNDISGIRFADAAGKVVVLEASRPSGETAEFEYKIGSSGNWMESRTYTPQSEGLDLKIDQDVDRSPKLVAMGRLGSSRVIWDPNPQLLDVDLGKVETLTWKDEKDRSWTGGLYLPPNFSSTHRYPLVIQAHNFAARVFRPSGLYPSGYAARALAGSGIIVLQTRCDIAGPSTDEGSCQVDGYRSAIKLLNDRGIIDPHKVGIVGFSRACYYAITAMTDGRLSFLAASLTDGFNAGYWQFLSSIDMFQNAAARESEIMNGGPPFGLGLKSWIDKAPTFNLDKVHAATQIVGLGRYSLMFMWEPYAVLRYQEKPVDLVLIKTRGYEHVLTEPRARLASQGGTVDWMRFWLQGYEDPDPAKRSEYRRWEGLCDRQRSQNPTSPVFCVVTRHQRSTRQVELHSPVRVATSSKGRLGARAPT